MALSPSIRPYKPADQKAFSDLNREWLEKYFYVEPEDEDVLGDPGTYIIKPGGEIWVVELDGIVVGCCALIAHTDGTLELAKMAVAPKHHGLGLGRLLGEKIIERSKARGTKWLYIVSNTKLETAILLYRKLGFKDSKVDKHSRFNRGNITLELAL